MDTIKSVNLTGLNEVITIFLVTNTALGSQPLIDGVHEQPELNMEISHVLRTEILTALGAKSVMVG